MKKWLVPPVLVPLLLAVPFPANAQLHMFG